MLGKRFKIVTSACFVLFTNFFGFAWTTSTTYSAYANQAASGEVYSSDHPRIALALGGGGTRGVAHVGVLRVLQREKIPIDAIAGTSMGAIVGGFYCAGLSPDAIETRLLDHQLLHAYHTIPIPIRVAAIPLFYVPHLFGYHPYEGLYRGNKFRNYLNSQVAECKRDIEELTPRFCAVASNLRDGKAYGIRSGNLGRAIQASSAIPFLRKPVIIDDKVLVDGGLEANLPVKEARSMGADVVIAVNVDETFENIPSERFRHVLSVPHQAISMLLERIDQDQVAAADIVIHPDVNGIYLLSTKRKDAERAIRAGELAAEAALPAIRERLKLAAVAVQ